MHEVEKVRGLQLHGLYQLGGLYLIGLMERCYIEVLMFTNMLIVLQHPNAKLIGKSVHDIQLYKVSREA